MSEITDNIKEVIIYCGGASLERETSLVSGKSISTALKSIGATVHLVELTCDARATLAAVRRHASVPAIILLHGGFGEDGSIQGVLATQGTPFSGSRAAAAAFAMNKHISKILFQAGGLSTPEWRYFRNKDEARDSVMHLDGQYFLKSTSLGSSFGVYPIRTFSDFGSALEKLPTGPVILEKWKLGRIVTVGVCDVMGSATVLSPVEIIPTNSDYYDAQAKYCGAKEYGYLEDISKATRNVLKDTALKAHKILGLSGLSRVDFILDREGVFVLEVNAIPGMGEKGNFVAGARRDGYTIQDVAQWLVQSIR